MSRRKQRNPRQIKPGEEDDAKTSAPGSPVADSQAGVENSGDESPDEEATGPPATNKDGDKEEARSEAAAAPFVTTDLAPSWGGPGELEMGELDSDRRGVRTRIALQAGVTWGPYPRRSARGPPSPGSPHSGMEGSALLGQMTETGCWLAHLPCYGTEDGSNCVIYSNGDGVWCTITCSVPAGEELVACAVSDPSCPSHLPLPPSLALLPQLGAPAPRHPLLGCLSLLPPRPPELGVIVPPSPINRSVFPCTACGIWYRSERNLQAHLQFYCAGRLPDGTPSPGGPERESYSACGPAHPGSEEATKPSGGFMGAAETHQPRPRSGSSPLPFGSGNKPSSPFGPPSEINFGACSCMGEDRTSHCSRHLCSLEQPGAFQHHGQQQHQQHQQQNDPQQSSSEQTLGVAGQSSSPQSHRSRHRKPRHGSDERAGSVEADAPSAVEREKCVLVDAAASMFQQLREAPASLGEPYRGGESRATPRPAASADASGKHQQQHELAGDSFDRNRSPRDFLADDKDAGNNSGAGSMEDCGNMSPLLGNGRVQGEGEVHGASPPNKIGHHADFKSEPLSPRPATSPMQYGIGPSLLVGSPFPKYLLPQEFSGTAQASEILAKMSELVHRRVHQQQQQQQQDVHGFPPHGPPFFCGPVLPKGTTCFECNITFNGLENYLVHKKYYCTSRRMGAHKHLAEFINVAQRHKSEAKGSLFHKDPLKGLPQSGEGSLLKSTLIHPEPALEMMARRPLASPKMSNSNVEASAMETALATAANGERGGGSGGGGGGGGGGGSTSSGTAGGGASATDGKSTPVPLLGGELKKNTCEACNITFSKQETFMVHKQYYCATRHEPLQKRAALASKLPALPQGGRTRRRRKLYEMRSSSSSSEHQQQQQQQHHQQQRLNSGGPGSHQGFSAMSAVNGMSIMGVHPKSKVVPPFPYPFEQALYNPLLKPPQFLLEAKYHHHNSNSSSGSNNISSSNGFVDSSGSPGPDGPIDLSKKLNGPEQKKQCLQDRFQDYHECASCKISFTEVEGYIVHKQFHCPAAARCPEFVEAPSRRRESRYGSGGRHAKLGEPSKRDSAGSSYSDGKDQCISMNGDAGNHKSMPPVAKVSCLYCSEVFHDATRLFVHVQTLHESHKQFLPYGGAIRENMFDILKVQQGFPSDTPPGEFAAKADVQQVPLQPSGPLPFLPPSPLAKAEGPGEGRDSTSAKRESPGNNFGVVSSTSPADARTAASPSSTDNPERDGGTCPSSGSPAAPPPPPPPPPPEKVDSEPPQSTVKGVSAAANGNGKYCRLCDIHFSNLSTFIAHKKFYCASHAAEHVK
ncbi:zinc finger protein ZFPM2-like isoform X2 [Petromyzon marinus]|uniref:zinc finger protein ZFPM2-like isoform X2 n=1 Tax=Petromyzon marinus TaxID=7757 RepID=UPI003F71C606